MRVSLLLTLTLTALTMTAAAEKHQKPKAKPSYTEEKQAKSPNRTVKPPAAHASAAQELRHVEQSSAKVTASHRAGNGQQARVSPGLKAQKNDTNPPIHVSGGGGHGSKGSKGADRNKGRLRHKGSHK